MDFRRGRKREDPEINLIPFIDVLLVILIFLMVTTTYSKFTELQITLPTADAEKALDKPFELNITVDAKGNYTVNNNPVVFRNTAGLAEDMQAATRAGNNGQAPAPGAAAGRQPARGRLGIQRAQCAVSPGGADKARQPAHNGAT